MGAHDLLEAGYNVAVVKNHNGDPYANTFSNTRNTYYGINSFPTATFDGLNAISGGSNTASMFSSYLPRVTARLAVPSKYTITAEGSLEGNVLSVDVTVSKPEDDTNTGVYLRSYLTESAIMQNWQGQTRLDNVNRSMAPNATGTPINLATGESTTVTLTFQINDAWQVPNLELVLFLQNNSSKEILQGKKYNVPGLTGAFPASTQNLVFPDTYVTGFSTKPITFYNYGDNPVTASIASNNPLFIPDVTTITIPSTSSRVVNVSYAPTATGTSTGILTVTGNFNQHPVLEITLTGNAFINTAPVAEDVVINGPPVIN
ncbi:MAG TPA: Omp28-related outer membrane protein, partial [Candidatus Cloacimonadota bacterium]|nr:Omp28-related outer membrane protein [Candidatus Cloacimonadota bacterium]